jgi:hypothetical protein
VKIRHLHSRFWQKKRRTCSSSRTPQPAQGKSATTRVEREWTLSERQWQSGQSASGDVVATMAMRDCASASKRTNCKPEASGNRVGLFLRASADSFSRGNQRLLRPLVYHLHPSACQKINSSILFIKSLDEPASYESVSALPTHSAELPVGEHGPSPRRRGPP